MLIKKIIGIHKNEDFAGEYLGSDDKFDYSMVNTLDNNHSATRYFGERGGEYESYPLYMSYVGNPRPPQWVEDMIIHYLRYFNYEDKLLLEYCQKHGIHWKPEPTKVDEDKFGW